ncbi:MAG: hypothetical protein OEY14_18100, partial [Myxococcales bacterium]|nr:hypothetical protein [Myxococcales bacterium]
MEQEVQTTDQEASGFPCSGCGAPNMRFDASSGALRCEFCGTETAVGREEGSSSIVERSLEAGLSNALGRGFGAEVRRVACSTCGASVSFDPRQTSTRCDFCGSPHVLEQPADPNLVRPEALIPFSIEQSVARAKFSDWLGGLWFRPSDLKARASVGDVQGVYVPYWTFDSRVDSQWTAESGTYYYESETYWDRDPNGNSIQKTRQVRKIHWRPAWGQRADRFDDVLVCASRGLPEVLADQLRTFNTQSLRPYDPGYLSGFRAEEYGIGLDTAWAKGVSKMEATQRARCSGDVPGDTQRNLNVANHFSEQSFKHILLPIWISSYRYQDKPYRFLVNGQTGEVQGEAP